MAWGGREGKREGGRKEEENNSNPSLLALWQGIVRHRGPVLIIAAMIIYTDKIFPMLLRKVFQPCSAHPKLAQGCPGVVEPSLACPLLCPWALPGLLWFKRPRSP